MPPAGAMPAPGPMLAGAMPAPGPMFIGPPPGPGAPAAGAAAGAESAAAAGAGAGCLLVGQGQHLGRRGVAVRRWGAGARRLGSRGRRRFRGRGRGLGLGGGLIGLGVLGLLVLRRHSGPRPAPATTRAGPGPAAVHREAVPPRRRRRGPARRPTRIPIRSPAPRTPRGAPTTSSTASWSAFLISLADRIPEERRRSRPEVTRTHPPLIAKSSSRLWRWRPAHWKGVTRRSPRRGRPVLRQRIISCELRPCRAPSPDPAAVVRWAMDNLPPGPGPVAHLYRYWQAA